MGAEGRGRGPSGERRPIAAWAWELPLRCASSWLAPAPLGAPPSRSPRVSGLRTASLTAMAAAAAGVRAFGAKGPGWLRRSPWAPLVAGFCSRGTAGAGQPEPGPRPTSVRQQDGIRSARGGWRPGPRTTWGGRRGPGGGVGGGRPPPRWSLRGRVGGRAVGAESPLIGHCPVRRRGWPRMRGLQRPRARAR